MNNTLPNGEIRYKVKKQKSNSLKWGEKMEIWKEVKGISHDPEYWFHYTTIFTLREQ